MNSQYVHITVSAESEDQAGVILDGLLRERLISGGSILSAPTRLWWQGEIVEQDYWHISAYSVAEYQEVIIAEVGRLSDEEVPIIEVVPMDGNEAFLRWIDESLAGPVAGQGESEEPGEVDPDEDEDAGEDVTELYDEDPGDQPDQSYDEGGDDDQRRTDSEETVIRVRPE